MLPLTLYLRREPTLDPVILKYAPQEAHQDVAAYRDAACTIPFVRWEHFDNKPDRRNRYVNLDGYRWRVEWLPDADFADAAVWPRPSRPDVAREG